MSFFKRLFSSKPKDDDYEAVLSQLASDIQKRRVRLSEIRLRERRAALLVTLYTLSAWVAYVSAWYYQVLPFSQPSFAARALLASPVFLGPIMSLFVRRIVQIWYNRIGNAEEKTLLELEKTRRDKVEEIKKKTNYYSTRDLLMKYDDARPSNSPDHTPSPGKPRNVPHPPQTPLTRPLPGHLSATPLVPTHPGSRPGAPISQASALRSSPLPPQPPPRKQWYDRLVDAALGADESEDRSKYALICEHCYTHNGLARPEDWETIQYICPKCKHHNRPHAKNIISSSSLASGGSPTTPESISQAVKPRGSQAPLDVPPSVPTSPIDRSNGMDIDDE